VSVLAKSREMAQLAGWFAELLMVENG